MNPRTNRLTRLLATSLCLALTSSFAFSAAPVASDTDIGKAMNSLPAGIQKNLDQDATAARNANPAGETLSPRCRQLRADIERAQHAAPEPQRDSYPEGPARDGRARAPTSSAIPGVQGRPAGNIEYGRRARLEEQFQRECQ